MTKHKYGIEAYKEEKKRNYQEGWKKRQRTLRKRGLKKALEKRQLANIKVWYERGDDIVYDDYGISVFVMTVRDEEERRGIIKIHNDKINA